jgi:hypothetical protein
MVVKSIDATSQESVVVKEEEYYARSNGALQSGLEDDIET